MFTVAALSEYLDLDGSDSPAFLALYARVVTTLSPSDRALLDAIRAEKEAQDAMPSDQPSDKKDDPKQSS